MKYFIISDYFCHFIFFESELEIVLFLIYNIYV